ncbi:similar to Saccharomyces cerevisiae YKL168C KKQ8 Putative serine/threonine protein kinase with unknown cellular role [Maudiozyma saulgeensis]|uniref:non-specific serine/threonine protein kinase n=1 Tax=Maudiozyma saulgeensis TaxID=1789683 RepID=A0A1X7R9K7_9SACH|nr:similar to Saccharomyces cerevisiae YKL168C KKQ8 Putative serine/threonine protein kinase with unknown cellular role [Kazachstania saulgeensis]
MTLSSERRRSRSSSITRARSFSASIKSIFKSSHKLDDEEDEEIDPRESIKSFSTRSRQQSPASTRTIDQNKILTKLPEGKESKALNSRNNSNRSMGPPQSARTISPTSTRKNSRSAISPTRAMSIKSEESYVSDEDNMMDKVAFPKPEAFYESDTDSAISTIDEDRIPRGRERGRKSDRDRTRAQSINTGSISEEMNDLSIDMMLESNNLPRRTASTKSFSVRSTRPTAEQSNGTSIQPTRQNSSHQHRNSTTFNSRNGMKTVPILASQSSSSASNVSRHNSTSKARSAGNSNNNDIKKSNSLRKVDSASSVSSMTARENKLGRPNIRGRPHADTVSASNLQHYHNSNCYHSPNDDAKCILSVDNFKVFENGTHEHNLKTISLVHGSGDGSNLKSLGSMFSFSGFFKPHSKVDDNSSIPHEKDEDRLIHFKDAISLIPKKAIHSTEVRSRSNPGETDDNNTSNEDDINDDNDPDKKRSNSKKNIPQVVNPKAAVSSDELELINTLSKKILSGLSGKRKTSIKSPDDPNSPAVFSDLYGKSIGTIGQGAYGVVSVSSRPLLLDDIPPYPSFVKENRMYFAVKELKPRSSDQVEKFSTKITSEFIIGHSLSRKNKCLGRAPPNILTVIDLMEKDNTFIEVMEFCPSGDLYSLLTRKSKSGTSLHPLEADCFMKQLLNGVKYMHDHGVAHCDLKPENILFQPDGLLKICDFGTSCVFQTAWERHVHFQSGAMGSEPYVAPEEFNINNEYDPRLVDLWSCGVVYCTMVLGHYLWKIASPGNDSLYDSFLEEMEEDKQFYLFEELRHVNHDINKLRKIALYKIFQVNPERRITVDQLLLSSWMKRTRCCISYKKVAC